jgi:hypothetical protein
MVRRSFRVGLWIGLVLGVMLALRRTVQLRRAAEHPLPSPEPWPPVLVDDQPEARFGGVVRPEPEPVVDEPVHEAAEEVGVEEPAPAVEGEWDVPEIEEPATERELRPAPAPAPPLLSTAPAADAEVAVSEPHAPARAAKKAAGPSRATAKKTARAKKPATAWVEPNEGVCPNTHPIKAKLTSGIFHLPGMFAYDRTKPDRCYARATDAEADGLHRAKR